MEERPQLSMKPIALLVYSLVAWSAAASTESSFDIDLVVMECRKREVRVEVRAREQRLESVTVMLAKREITVPMEELKDLHKVDLQSVRLTSFGDPAVRTTPLHYLVVSIDLEPTAVHDEGEREKLVCSVVRFVITDKGYERRERAEPDGVRKNSWRLYYKEVAQREIPNGVEASIQNPYK